MSEEILKALMQLFAIITKQDNGVSQLGKKYVEDFLTQQVTSVELINYMNLFESFLGTTEKSENEESKKRLTSVSDSVRTLAICKKINKTLSQKQKIVVLVRLLELIKTDSQLSNQRMAIIHTVAEVFNVEKLEFSNIEKFILDNNPSNFDGDHFLFINEIHNHSCESCRKILTEQLDGFALIMHVPSVDLYFLKYDGNSELVLNGVPIEKSRIMMFAVGSTLKIPYGKPIFYSDVIAKFKNDSQQDLLAYHAENLYVRFDNGYLGLRDISLSENSGKLVGIMGASGAGKTTLLNVLCGIEKPTSGKVSINGIDIHKENDKIKGIIGYIPQDDLLIEELTVYQNLYFNAKLCLADKTEAELDAVVLKVLESLGILEIKDLQVGNPMLKKISGGQRKRLNIGIELLREPAILFVDEPTSGLSSLDSENVIDLLRELALKGKLIFVVIHQPSSDIYKMFDKMIFLDVGGYMIYNGNPVEGVDYFKNADKQVQSNLGSCAHCGTVNSEVVFNIIEAKVVDEYGRFTNKRKKTPVEWKSLYDKNFSFVKVDDIHETPTDTLKIPSRFKQIQIFSVRDLLSKLKNKQYLLINLLEAPILALLLSLIIRSNPDGNHYIFRENQNVPAYIFMCIIVSLFMGLTISAEEIFKDRKILKRESLLNLSRSSYLFSKLILLFSISAIQVLLFVIIGNSILGIKGMFVDYWYILFTVQCFANVLGLLISSSLDSAIAIYILIPLLIIPQMILGGAMFKFEHLNKLIGGGFRIPAIAQVMPSRWAYEALTVDQFKNNKYEKPFFKIEKMESETNYKLEFYLPELKNIINETQELLKESTLENHLKITANLALLKIEFDKEHQLIGEIGSYDKALLNADTFNKMEAFKLLTHLQKLNDYYSEHLNKVLTQKDNIIEKLQETEDAAQAFMKSKDEYYNSNLSDIVKKVQEPKKIIRTKNGLQQIEDAIFMSPEKSLLGLDAQFYAPHKYLFKSKMETLLYNSIMIWFYAMLLFIMLYFNAIRKLFAWIDTLRIYLVNAYHKLKFGLPKNAMNLQHEIKPGHNN